MEESSKASRRLGITEDSVASNEDEVRESNEQAEDVNFTPGFMLPEILQRILRFVHKDSVKQLCTARMVCKKWLHVVDGMHILQYSVPIRDDTAYNGVFGSFIKRPVKEMTVEMLSDTSLFSNKETGIVEWLFLAQKVVIESGVSFWNLKQVLNHCSVTGTTSIYFGSNSLDKLDQLMLKQVVDILSGWSSLDALEVMVSPMMDTGLHCENVANMLLTINSPSLRHLIYSMFRYYETPDTERISPLFQACNAAVKMLAIKNKQLKSLEMCYDDEELMTEFAHGINSNRDGVAGNLDHVKDLKITHICSANFENGTITAFKILKQVTCLRTLYLDFDQVPLEEILQSIDMRRLLNTNINTLEEVTLFAIKKYRCLIIIKSNPQMATIFASPGTMLPSAYFCEIKNLNVPWPDGWVLDLDWLLANIKAPFPNITKLKLRHSARYKREFIISMIRELQLEKLTFADFAQHQHSSCVELYSAICECISGASLEIIAHNTGFSDAVISINKG